jgi:cytochrome c oxidase subunit 2
VRKFVVLAIPLLAACSRWQNAVVPAGPQAARIDGLGRFLTIVAVATTLLVWALLAYVVARGRRRVAAGEPADESPRTERTMANAVGFGVAVSAVVLFVFLIVTVRTGRALDAFGGERDARGTQGAPPSSVHRGARAPLVVEVTGKQWWWQVVYRDSAPSRRVTTANEIHIPVGRPVHIYSRSTDVIHSFWVPNLHGKKDGIPGYTNDTWIQADSAGVYRGQCAEYCGYQHAHMALEVIAEPEERFEQWYTAQLAPAAAPTDSSAKRGHDVFVSSSCMMCHAIAGEPLAGSSVGPDLTHFASRPTIAAGTLPNTRGHLAGWIVDPQRIKPGAHMPPNALSPDDLNALLDYLRSLK